MKFKLAGVFMAFLFCISMVGGSFAYASETCPTKLTDLTGHSIQKGQTATFHTTLWSETQTGFIKNSWSKVLNKPVTYSVSDSNNNVLFTETKTTSTGWDGTMGETTFKVDTKSHGMDAGLYHITAKFNGATNVGNTKDTYLPCEASVDLIVND